MFYYTLDHHTLNKITDKNALAAAMLTKGGYDVMDQSGFVTHILMTNKKKIKEMLSYTGGGTDND